MGNLCRTRFRSIRFRSKMISSFLLPIAALVSVSAFGQGVVGEFVPDVGFDLSGNWNPLLHEDFLERIPGPELVNYTGLPITEGSRLWGESWNSSRLTLPEHQCQVHVSPYIYRGPLQMRFWDEKDPQSQKIIAIKNYISTYEQTRTIWMDGRPHPPAWAAHTWMGFSTGKWEGMPTSRATRVTSPAKALSWSTIVLMVFLSSRISPLYVDGDLARRGLRGRRPL